jgi:hypothetical protein
MALGDVGIFNPAESTFMRPGAYEDALRADALKRATYLSMMDQFYEQLDETKREFDATASFKYAALAQDKWIAEQQIGLSREELALKRELGTADISLRERTLTEESSYRKEALGVERMKVNASRPSISLGGESSIDKATSFLSKYMTTAGTAGSGYYSVEGRPIQSLSTGGPGVELPTPSSGEVSYDWYA